MHGYSVYSLCDSVHLCNIVLDLAQVGCYFVVYY